MKKAWIFILGFLLLHACIEIEDKIDPTVEQFELLAEYEYLDTIKVSVNLEDNSAIDCVLVTIKSVEPVPNGNNWEVSSTVRGVKRRFYDSLYQFVVPAGVERVRYEFKVENYDADNNQAVERDTFRIVGDETGPVIQINSIGLATLEGGGANEFLACRRDRLTINGVASDNIQLSQIGYRLSGGVTVDGEILVQDFGRGTTGNEVDLAPFFGQAISIPIRALDSNTNPILLTIRATDTQGNLATQDFRIFVNCDDVLPSIQIAQSDPLINEVRDGEGSVVLSQGSSLSFQDIQVMDNRYIKNAEVTFLVDGNEVQKWESDINASALPINLVDFLPFQIDLEKDASITSDYRLEIAVRDSVNQTPTQYVINMQVVKDDPPVLEGFGVNIASSNGTASFLPVGDQAFAVSALDRISFEGKVKDDYGLKQVVVYINGNDVVTVEPEAGEELDPVSLTNFFEDITIEIPEEAVAGEIYTFRLYSKDNLDQETDITLTFTVQ